MDWTEPDDEIAAAVAAVLDAFTGNAHFYDETEEHCANVLRQGVTLMDNAELQARYLTEAKSWLARWRPALAETYGAGRVVNAFFVLLFRGHQRQAFRDVIVADGELIRILVDFALDDWMLDTDDEYLAANAGRELARFSQYGEATIYPAVRDGIKSVLERYEMDGEGSRIWVATAAGAAFHDGCEVYGICGFEDELEARVLAVRHACHGGVTIRAQSLEPDQLETACGLLEAQERYFHRRLRTGGMPVPDDFNSTLEVVVFADSGEYATYSNVFFGNDTNNGGIYLEGDPSDPGNTARFIAFVATWLDDRPVWNLEHEQVHYLDGRFNLHGSFGDYRVDTHHTVWWAEGLAEYVSRRNDNPAAVETGRSGDVPLSEVFRVVYSDGVTMVYRWSYLAVRFMFERHRDVVDALLVHFRAGDYDAYRRHLEEDIGTVYDAEWTAWLLDVAANEDSTPDLVDLPRRLAVDEGSTATYRIALATQPAGDVGVEIAVVGANLTVEPASLAFSAQEWDAGKTVRVTAPEDENTLHEAAKLVHTASGGRYDAVRAMVSVAVRDSAPTISFVDAVVWAREGGTAVHEVVIERALESATTFGYRTGADTSRRTHDADAADYDAVDGEATIPAGETLATIEIAIRDDDDIEPARETLVVSLDPSTITGFAADRIRAAVVIREGVCDRTPGVRDVLRRDRPCDAVTVADLEDEYFVDLSEGLHGTLRAGDFQGLTGVFDIRLYDNRLETLPAGAFADMRVLRLLFLNNNELRHLPLGAFDGPTTLELLALNGNDLSELPPGVFEGHAALTALELQDNPGAPFALTLEWFRHRDLSVVATVREGAPFDMRADVSAEGGTLSADSVVVPAGATASEPITVASDGAGPVRVSFTSTPAVPDDRCHGEPCFMGVTTAVGAAVVIGAGHDTFAHAPLAEALPVGVEMRIALADLFPGMFPDGAASYSAASGAPSVVDVRIDDGMLVLSPKAAGAALVAVTATVAGVPTIIDLPVTVEEPVLAAVPYFPSASDAAGRQGFLRIVNHGGRPTALGIDVFDDDGASLGSLVLSVGAKGAAHVNSRDLAEGNRAKGLFGGASSGHGDWRLDLSTVPGVQVLSYVRTSDGLVASMHDTVPSVDGNHRVAIFNPGSNTAAESLLRLANPTGRDATATIVGIDDHGARGGEVSARIPARGALTVSAHELESGAAPGLSGALGDGGGKWRLDIASADAIEVMSLLSSSTGHVTNLSTAPSKRTGDVHAVPLFPAASDALGRKGYARVVNLGDSEAKVNIAAFDETDRVPERLTLMVGGEPDDSLHLRRPRTGQRRERAVGCNRCRGRRLAVGAVEPGGHRCDVLCPDRGWVPDLDARCRAARRAPLPGAHLQSRPQRRGGEPVAPDQRRRRTCAGDYHGPRRCGRQFHRADVGCGPHRQVVHGRRTRGGRCGVSRGRAR